MKPEVKRVICTDVVVLGGGAAGLRAAIEARRNDVDVLVVCAGRIGHANNSCISHGGFSTSMFQDGDSVERFYEDTIKGGSGLNSRFLVQMLSNDISAEVSALERMGVIFRRLSDGRYALEGRGGHSIARRLTTINSSGMELLVPLVKVVEESKIRVLEGFKAVLLLEREGYVSGVVGITRRGEWSFICAKAVILATGGGGALYPKTTNVPWAKGCGYALAYEAGLSLQDMEFIQFVLHHKNDPGIPARIPPIEIFLLGGADLLSSKGLSILRRVDSFTRDSIARAAAIAMEEDDESAGFVYLDLTNFRTPENQNIAKCLAKSIRVFPAAHFFMGGVRVLENLGTSIEGLYVAGEIMGGVHGANRLGGNALAEAFVFGAKSGGLAGRFAKKSAGNSVGLAYVIGELEKHQVAYFGGKSEFQTLEEISKLFANLRTIMGIHAGVLRKKSKLKTGLLALERIKASFFELPHPAPHQLWDWFDLWHSLIVAEIILRACLEREETRGAHYRQDFPEIDDENWFVNICVSKSTQERITINRACVSF